MRCRSTERVAHSRVKFQPRVDETLRWKVPPDPADPADLPDPGNQVSSAAVRNHSNTRAGGEDYVSSNQTPSNHSRLFFPNSWYSFRVLVGFWVSACTGVGGGCRWIPVAGFPLIRFLRLLIRPARSVREFIRDQPLSH